MAIRAFSNHGMVCPLNYTLPFADKDEEKPRTKSIPLKALCQWIGTNEFFNDL